MPYLIWSLYIFPSFVMAIVGRILAPFLPFFVQENGYLPTWLWWFQTPDNPCDGDRGHWKRWPGTDPWSTYKRRVAWFLRNVAYGFDETVCGIKTRPTDCLEIIGNEDASDKNGISGLCKYYLYRDGKLIGWQVYYIKHYKVWRITACIRINMGWKLWNPECINKQWTCYAHPWKTLRLEKDNG